LGIARCVIYSFRFSSFSPPNKPSLFSASKKMPQADSRDATSPATTPTSSRSRWRFSPHSRRERSTALRGGVSVGAPAFYAFDLIYQDRDLIDVSLEVRKDLLSKLITGEAWNLKSRGFRKRAGEGVLRGRVRGEA